MLSFVVGLTLFFTSCSHSRLLDSERILAQGSHRHGTISGSNILIPNGASLDVSFSFENRFFVANGGQLTGFERGVRSSKIYAEKGANLPHANTLRGITIVPVKSAAEAYQKRFQALPPLKFRSPSLHAPSSDDHDGDDDDDFSSRRPSHPTVIPSSYQKKD